MIKILLLISLTIPLDTFSKENLLDFEDNIIEGEVKTPDIFLQVTNDEIELENIEFDRKNFNSFFKEDKKYRPRYKGK